MRLKKEVERLATGNELVKYGNELNTVPFRSFTNREFNVFFAIISRLRDHEDNKVTLTFDKIKELSDNHQHKGQFISDLRKTYDKLQKLTVYNLTDDKYQSWVLFDFFEINTKKEEVTVRVNRDLTGVLNNLSQWTRFNLRSFVKLRSSYSKSMFRLLKQYRTSGKRRFKIEDFRRLLDIPKSYRSSDINSRVIKPIKHELPPYFENLHIRKLKKHTQITGYSFSWKPSFHKQDDFSHGALQDAEDKVMRMIGNSDLSKKDKESINADIMKSLSAKDKEKLVHFIKGKNEHGTHPKPDISSLNPISNSKKAQQERRNNRLNINDDNLPF